MYVLFTVQPTHSGTWGPSASSRERDVCSFDKPPAEARIGVDSAVMRSKGAKRASRRHIRVKGTISASLPEYIIN